MSDLDKHEERELRKQRMLVKALEVRLYDPDAEMSRDERFELSMQLGAERSKLAEMLKIEGWSADAALDTPEEE